MLKWMGGVALAALLSTGALASQSSLWSPTTGVVSGLSLTLNYNAALAALASCNSGAAAPANTQSGAPSVGQCWLNTSVAPNLLETWDGAQWVTLGSLDTTNHLWAPAIGGFGPITAAATTDLGTQPTVAIQINGAATISSFGTSAPVGAVKALIFYSAGAVLVNSASLVLPGGANITTAVGDTAIAVQTVAGVWSVAYYRATGQPLYSGVPTGAVMAFALSSCPSGWIAANGTNSVDMRGVVARGYDPGNVRDPAGSSQSIGSYEADMYQQHTEQAPPGGFVVFQSGGVQVGVATSTIAINQTAAASTGLSNSGNYGPETRAKSTILLYCQKT